MMVVASATCRGCTPWLWERSQGFCKAGAKAKAGAGCAWRCAPMLGRTRKTN